MSKRSTLRLGVALPLTAAFAGATLGAPLAASAQSAGQRAALAQLIPVQAGATVDRDSVTVGDVVRLTIRVRAPVGATINFPAGVDSLGPVQSLEPPQVRNGADSASATDRIAVYRVAAWDVGALAIRLGEVLVQTDDGERRIGVRLPTLAVRSVLPADSTLHVPKAARQLIPARPVAPWWLWLAIALAIVALAGLVWWWRSRRRGSTAPTGDPYADAERDFERVERLGLVAVGEHGRHAVLMTDVLRRYLAARGTGATLAHTSGELLVTLRGAPTVAHDQLQPLLERVDAVKFARAPLGGNEARAIGTDARAIVRHEHERAAAIAAAVAAPSQPGARAA